MTRRECFNCKGMYNQGIFFFIKYWIRNLVEVSGLRDLVEEQISQLATVIAVADNYGLETLTVPLQPSVVAINAENRAWCGKFVYRKFCSDISFSLIHLTRIRDCRVNEI